MKNTALGLMMALLVTGSAFAAIPDGGAHDLRTRLGIDEICLPCHAPHHAAYATAGPIWNHQVTTATFVRNGENVTLEGASKLCMSCHDGVTAVGNYGGTTTDTDKITGGANLGTDLTDDHPVGVEYPTRGPYVPAEDIASYLHDGKVECTSCHRAHTDTEKLLRVSVTDSALCRVCHRF